MAKDTRGYIRQVFKKILNDESFLLNACYLLIIVCCLIYVASSLKSMDPYSKYEGMWEYRTEKNISQGEVRIHVMKITRQGKSYLLNLNILESQEYALLSKGGKEQLMLGGLCGIPIGFGASTDILYFNRDIYHRIDVERLEQIKNNLKQNKL